MPSGARDFWDLGTVKNFQKAIRFRARRSRQSADTPRRASLSSGDTAPHSNPAALMQVRIRSTFPATGTRLLVINRHFYGRVRFPTPILVLRYNEPEAQSSIMAQNNLGQTWVR